MNLILINGQLKYYQKTLLYWKEFAIINNADIYFICQSTTNYKDGKKEKVSVPWIKKHIPNASIFFIEENLDKVFKNHVRFIFDSIEKHNRIYNANHNLEQYSGLSYLERCFYRQISTLYAFDYLIPREKLSSYDRILYARSDFLLGIISPESKFLNGHLYKTSVVCQQDGMICLKKLGVPCIAKERNFSVSDYMYWCEYPILYNYLSAYLANFYKFSWPNNTVENTVEAQANQTRRFLNQSLPKEKQLVDIYDFPNRLFSCNYFYDARKKIVMMRFWRVKTKASLEKLSQVEPSSSSPSCKIHIHQMLDKFITVTEDGTNAFELFCNGNKKTIEEIVKSRPTIIKIDMNHFILEQRSLCHDRIDANHFCNVVSYALYLMELKKKYPQTIFMIHTNDMHRMNWELFFYYIKILKIEHVFAMYAPWFARSILKTYQEKDYRKDKVNFDVLQKYNPKSFVYSFFPKYLWKTRGILESCEKQKSEAKDYDILFYGCTHAPINPDSFSKNSFQNKSHIDIDTAYPFRKRLLNLLQGATFSSLRIKIVEWLPKNDPKGVYDKDLFHLISKSKFTIATTSSLQYLLRKYYEIPMAGSIIIGNITDYAPSIYENNIIKIHMKMSDKELTDTILSAVKKYELHRRKEILGKTLREIAQVYHTENDFLEDYIHFQQSKIKSEKLAKFFDLYGWVDLQKLSTEYANDF